MSWAAFGLTFLGVLLVAFKLPIGQFTLAASQVLWSLIGYRTGNSALLLQSILLGTSAIVTGFLWSINAL